MIAKRFIALMLMIAVAGFASIAAQEAQTESLEAPAETQDAQIEAQEPQVETQENREAQEARETEELGAEGETVYVPIVASGFAFDQDTITVPAGANVVMTFSNLDGAPHNVAIYRSSDATETIFQGDLITGPNETITYEFTAPEEPGTYFFRCDIHPSMAGDFIVE